MSNHVWGLEPMPARKPRAPGICFFTQMVAEFLFREEEPRAVGSSWVALSLRLVLGLPPVKWGDASKVGIFF